MDDDSPETPTEILKDIRGEIQNLNAQLARTDQRSQMNQENVQHLREDRIEPLEEQADENEARSRRNSLILGGMLTLATMLCGTGLSFMFGVL